MFWSDQPERVRERPAFQIEMVSVFTVFWSYQPKGVSLRLCHEPEANAFRLISHLQTSVFIWFLSGTLSLASGFRMILSNKPCANALRLMDSVLTHCG